MRQVTSVALLEFALLNFALVNFALVKPRIDEPSGSQILQKESHHAIHQVNSSGRVIRRMSAARQQYYFNVFPIFYGFVEDERCIDQMNVVVARSLPDHQLSLQAIYEVNRRRSPVSFRVILRQAEKPLRRDRIILKP